MSNSNGAFLPQIKAKLGELFAKRDGLIAEMEGVIAANEARGGGLLTDDESRRFDAFKADITQVDLDIAEARLREAELEAHASRVGLANQTKTSKAIGASTGNPFEGRAEDLLQRRDTRSLIGQAKSAIERSIVGTDGNRERLTRNLERAAESDSASARLIAAAIVTTMDPFYIEALSSIAMRGSQAMHTAAHVEAVERSFVVARALASDAVSGSYLVPAILDPAFVIVNDGATVGTMRRLAAHKTIVGDGDTLKGISTSGISVEWINGQNVVVADATPTLAQPSIQIHTQDAFVTFSHQLPMDQGEFLNELSKAAIDALEVDLEQKLWTGSGGSGQPNGLLTLVDTSTGLEVVVTTDGALGTTDIRKLFAALPARYFNSPNVAVVAHHGTWGHLRQQASAAGGTGAFADLAAGSSAVFGIPAYNADSFNVFDSSTGARNYMMVGDFSRYLIVEKPTSVSFVEHMFDTTNNRPTLTKGAIFWRRIGADARDAGAGFRALQNQ